MREILFRGKRIDNGEWVEGDLAHKNRGDRTDMLIHFTENLNYRYFQVHPETVGQFTGLLDKSGKKIFEWDIVSDGSSNGTVFFNKDESQFQVDFMPYDDCPQEMQKNNNWAEIIGNIHDNPELIENDK